MNRDERIIKAYNEKEEVFFLVPSGINISTISEIQMGSNNSVRCVRDNDYIPYSIDEVFFKEEEINLTIDLKMFVSLAENENFHDIIKDIILTEFGENNIPVKEIKIR